MVAKRPYFLRAWYDWMVDNDLTPYVVVDAIIPQVEIPKAYIEEGSVTLNISPLAVNNFEMTLNAIAFEAAFGDPPCIESIYLPTQAIRAIYASENGQGTLFLDEEVEKALDQEALSSNISCSSKKKKKPKLTIVE